MRKLTLLAAAAFAATIASTPAQAAVVLCTGSNCVATDENVLVTASTSVPVVTGTTNNTGVGVTFNSSTDALLNGSANGQADVSSADGLLNGLTFTLQSGYYFTSALFNLFPLPGNQNNEATQVVITYFTPGLGFQNQTISTNGQNFIGITGNAGEQFVSAGFTANPVTDGIQDMRQLRLGGVAAFQQQAPVPEPSTWAMMLAGFGATGFAMRRTRRKKLLLAQAA